MLIKEKENFFKRCSKGTTALSIITKTFKNLKRGFRKNARLKHI